MNVGEQLLELVREEKREPEGQRHADQRRRGVDRQELAERHPGDTRGQERGGPDPGHVARREDDLHPVTAIRRLEALLALGRQHVADHAPVEDALAPVVTDPVEDDIAREHADQAYRQRDPPADDPLVSEDAGGEDRHLLGDRHAEAGDEEHQEDARGR